MMLCCRTSWLIFAATVAGQIRKPLGHRHLELFFSMLPSRLVFLSFPTKNGGIMWYPVFPLRFLESNILITGPFWTHKSCCYVSRLFFRRVSFGGYIPQAQILAFVYRSIYGIIREKIHTPHASILHIPTLHPGVKDSLLSRFGDNVQHSFYAFLCN